MVTPMPSQEQSSLSSRGRPRGCLSRTGRAASNAAHQLHVPSDVVMFATCTAPSYGPGTMPCSWVVGRNSRHTSALSCQKCEAPSESPHLLVDGIALMVYISSHEEGLIIQPIMQAGWRMDGTTGLQVTAIAHLGRLTPCERNKKRLERDEPCGSVSERFVE